MQLLVNGEHVHFEEGKTLAGLLRQLGYSGETFAVALNGDFVPRTTYEKTSLTAGDNLDIVAPVVGG
ncbi:sulfur carrier protein ThiS [Microbulbifer bruguierae]|uniref:Sulfur carrier protein ThiS n=1 Tax=Microbulbifer bruguierae TaxID=3029061 RepID=A0ABY8NH21_9GAMM|nr:sulfur carrier protein ThiS [Microbulbifer bruguierae]WGL17704.1 sulfur carrier protein ThiS [Microbulbifer bruguierae]